MKNFLKKYLTEDQLKELTDKYIKDNPEAKELPVYIAKNRLDEVLGQKKTAEEASAAATKELETYESEMQGKIDSAVKTAVDAAKAESQKEIDALKADALNTDAIYKAKGKNVKAIKALIDPSKKFEDELARIQKEESYLFGNKDDIDDGTGKGPHNDPNAKDKQEQAMRHAIGLN